MKIINNIFLVCVGLLSFTACEDVIELELEDTTPRVVIEGTLNMTTQTAQIFFTKSNGFYEEATPITISDAIAVLENEAGTSFTLEEVQPGLYSVENVAVTPDEKWSVHITSEGITYTASTVAPSPAILDTLITEIEERPLSDETDIRMSAEWNDEAGVQNFYRLRPFRNDTLITQTYNLINDDFADGTRIINPIMQEFELDNLIKMELLSVDENYYRYFLELSAVVGNGFTGSTPYNPIGNFDNNALGYFGIYSVSFKEVQL